MSKDARTTSSSDVEVSDKILTVPNVISFARLCCVPVFLVLLMKGYDLAATVMFAIAAGTDCVDGQIARRTNQVSKLGQLLDPTVDRVLMITGVAGLCYVGRLPVWIVVVVVVRDLLLLAGGAFLLKFYRIRIPVVYPGKFATTFLFVGFIGLLLNMPLLPGLALTTVSWLPGFGLEPCSWGIWLVYLGLVLALATAVYYVIEGVKALQSARDDDKAA